MWQVYQPARTIFGEGEIKNIGKYMEESLRLVLMLSRIRHSRM